MGKVEENSAEMLLLRGALGGIVSGLLYLTVMLFSGNNAYFYAAVYLGLFILFIFAIVGVIIGALIWTLHELAKRNFRLFERVALGAGVSILIGTLFYYTSSKSPYEQTESWLLYVKAIALIAPAGAISGAIVGNQTYIKPIPNS